MTVTDALRRDIEYLEQAEAHADEGPLGEPAARAILAIALKYARASTAHQSVVEALGRAQSTLVYVREASDCEASRAAAAETLTEIDATLNRSKGNG